MEALSLLKYWRGGGGVFTRDNFRHTDSSSTSSTAATTTTTIVTGVSPSSSSSDSDSDGGDDGPFFDLEFTLPVEEEDDDCDSEDQIEDHKDLFPDVVEELENVNDVKTEGELENDEEDQEEGEEIKFTLSSSSSGDSNDRNVTLSPSDDLFFKGRLVPIDPSSMILNASSESIHKFPPVSSLLKSATRFRVQMLKFNKPKSNLREKPEKSEPDQEKHENHGRKQSKFFTVKLKVEEVPLVSLFTRDNSSKGTNAKPIKRNVANHDVVVENTTDSSSPSSSSADEKKFSKDVMQKYLKKVKPLYIRVSKRYGDKLRFSGQLSFPKSGVGAPSTAEVKTSTAADGGGGGGDEGGESVGEVEGVSNAVKSNQKQGNLQAGLRVVCKHLGKSRSASSSVVTAPAAAPALSKRRDDSLLQQQDGIQSAIMHCKRSFNASRDLEGSILSRSASDPSHENR